MDQWIQIDNRLKEVNEYARQLRSKRDQLEDYIIKNNIVNDRVKVVDSKQYEPLTFKYLEMRLDEIIKNKDQLQQIVEYIKKRRTVTVSKELKQCNQLSIKE